MKIVATIEARMTSSRLPAKVLKPLGGKSMLEVIIERIRRSKHINEIVVATTINDTDKPIVDLCDKLDVRYCRGSEHDVLDRVLKAAKENMADIICELMGDSPFIDPELVDQVIEVHMKDKNDYTSNFYPKSFLPLGMQAQVFPVSSLEKTASLTDDPIDHVHVSCFMYLHPHIFKCGGVEVPEELRRPDIRLCVDTVEDYELINTLYTALKNPFFTCHDVISYLTAHPELLEINKNVRQKQINEG